MRLVISIDECISVILLACSSYTATQVPHQKKSSSMTINTFYHLLPWLLSYSIGLISIDWFFFFYLSKITHLCFFHFLSITIWSHPIVILNLGDLLTFQNQLKWIVSIVWKRKKHVKRILFSKVRWGFSSRHNNTHTYIVISGRVDDYVKCTFMVYKPVTLSQVNIKQIESTIGHIKYNYYLTYT